MFLTPLLASLLAAQPPAAPGQAALAQCLSQFVATQSGGSAEEFASAFANACLTEERAYRSAYVAAATARGTPFLDADSQAYSTALDLRIAQRAAYLAANTACGRPVAARPATAAAKRPTHCKP